MTRAVPTLLDRLPWRTSRLALRPLTMADAPAVAAMLADPEVMRHFPAPLSRTQSDAWLLRNLQRYERDGTGLFAVTRDEAWIGDCGLVRRQIGGHCVFELGYHFSRQVWGRGYATEAAAACVALARTAAPSLPLVALIRSGNVASRRVAARLGFAVQGAMLHAGHPHECWCAPTPAARDRRDGTLQ